MGQKHPRLKQDVLNNLVSKTRFSHSEINEWYKNFLKDCPSGNLRFEEFLKTYELFFPYGNVRLFAETVFKSFDKNGDGVIDFQEFLNTFNVTSRGNLEEKLQFAFQMYDLDHDGYINRAEMVTVINSIHQMVGNLVKLNSDELTPEQKTDKIFQMMDTNKDNRLSYEEFCNGIKNDPAVLQLLQLAPSSLLFSQAPPPRCSRPSLSLSNPESPDSSESYKAKTSNKSSLNDRSNFRYRGNMEPNMN